MVKVVQKILALLDKWPDAEVCKDLLHVDQSGSRVRVCGMGVDHDQESLTVYTDGFRAYEPLEEDDAFQRECVVHTEGEYADEEVHVNTCESHASLARRWLLPHRGLSKDNLTRYLRAFQLRRELLHKPGKEALKQAIQATL